MMFLKALPALVVLALSPVWANAADAPRAKHVFVISIDQGSPVSIEKADMPVLDKVAAEGAHTWEAYTIVPSLTLPSHTSMLTGVGIQKHQIDWNDFDAEKGLVKVPTIFSLAKEKGLRTAMVVGKSKFKTLQLPKTVDEFVLPKERDAESIANEFEKVMEKNPPNLCFIHFAEPDTKGHAHGANSPEKLQALAETDVALRRILETIKKSGVADSSVVIITADHGCHDIEVKDDDGKKRISGTHGSPSKEDVTIPWIAFGAGVKPHYTITAPVVQYDTAATALWLLGVPLPEHFWGRPVVSAFQ